MLEGYAPLEWTRVAITDVQVRERDFPVKTKRDNRFKPVRAFEAVETAALGQTAIVRLLTAVLGERVPEPLEVIREREEHQRVQVRERLSPGPTP